MNAWLSETFRLLESFFGRTSLAETSVVIALCIFLGALALSRIGTGLGALGAFYTTGMLLTPIGLVLLVSALALPSVFGQELFWMPLATACLVLLVVVIPLTNLFQKGSYVATLIAWTVAILVTGAVLTLEPRIKRSANEFKMRLENGRLFSQHRAEQELRK